MILPEILGHCVWEGILQTFPPNKRREFLTENRILKDCRNKRLLFLSSFHMPTFFFLYIDVKISNCFVLFNNLCFFPMAWRRVSKMEYFTHVSKAFHDQEFKRKMWTETEKSSLGGNNSNVTDQLLLTVTAVYTIIHEDQICNDFQNSTLILVLAALETPNSFWYQQKRVSILCALQKSTKHWVIIWIALFLDLKLFFWRRKV